MRMGRDHVQCGGGVRGASLYRSGRGRTAATGAHPRAIGRRRAGSVRGRMAATRTQARAVLRRRVGTSPWARANGCDWSVATYIVCYTTAKGGHLATL
jgi:hypothetical protein